MDSINLVVNGVNGISFSDTLKADCAGSYYSAMSATDVINECIKNYKENAMKNVLFLAPGYQYAKTVVSNQSKELDRKKIPYNASVATNNMYIHTDKVHVEIVYMDPVKWTPDLFDKRDAVFGKKELTDKAKSTFYTRRIPVVITSLSAYIRKAHETEEKEVTCPKTQYIPNIKNAYFNNPMTVVIWEDGTKTMVKCQPGDVYSAETGLALCIAKKAFGNQGNFNDIFKKFLPEDDGSVTETTTCASTTGGTVTISINEASVVTDGFGNRVRKALADIFKD